MLMPLFGLSPSYINDSNDFIEKLATVIPTNNTLMVSFDVSNLFPIVTVPECLTVVRDRLENDTSLKDRTKLLVSDHNGVT